MRNAVTADDPGYTSMGACRSRAPLIAGTFDPVGSRLRVCSPTGYLGLVRLRRGTLLGQPGLPVARRGGSVISLSAWKARLLPSA